MISHGIQTRINRIKLAEINPPRLSVTYDL